MKKTTNGRRGKPGKKEAARPAWMPESLVAAEAGSRRGGSGGTERAGAKKSVAATKKPGKSPGKKSAKSDMSRTGKARPDAAPPAKRSGAKPVSAKPARATPRSNAVPPIRDDYAEREARRYENPIARDLPSFIGAFTQDLEHHIALAHCRCVFDLQLFCHGKQIFGGTGFQVREGQTVLAHK